MKKFNAIRVVCVAALLTAAGGARSQSSKTNSVSLEGSWKGQEIDGAVPGESSLVISGTNLEFRGADSNEWCKATFTLHEDTNPKQLIAVVTACPSPGFIGKTENAIYRFEDGALRLAENAPGDAAMPTAFDAPTARQFLFKAAKARGSDLDALQGTWQGQLLGPTEPPTATLVISGEHLELKMADTNVWYKARFSLRPETNPKQLVATITACPFPESLGKTANGTYRFEEGGGLRMSANQPGDPAVPAGFDAPGVPQYFFRALKP